jgi:hypothetical protein
MAMKKLNLLKAIMMMIFVVLSLCVKNATGQNYYVLTYEDNRHGSDYSVYLKSINLATHRVQDSLLLMETGCIYTPIPINLSVGENQYRLMFVTVGKYDKNTSIGISKLYWWIEGGNGNIDIIKRDSLIGVTPLIIHYRDESYIRLDVYDEVNKRQLINDGKYILDDSLRFVWLGPIDEHTRPGQIGNIQSFEFPRRINISNPFNIYYAYGPDNQFWAVRLNSTNSNVIESVELGCEGATSTIFAYHPMRDKLYRFCLNYENQSRFPDHVKNYGQNWIHPEVEIYNSETLTVSERNYLADFDSANYPGRENGLADVVGDYIVYYFSDFEWLGQFDPAMLFIFDTRTNQATWLRVGWR